ncbi:MAG TPA: hypothetical protein VHL58_10660, partial [Thermoanaerobaculia bacterium]|nr:hypothetical protein [Thermoanaerobaculia bacterium]
MRKLLLIVLLYATSLSAQTLECHHLATWGARGSSRDFLVAGNRVYAADGRGVTLYDISNPAIIRVIASRETSRPSVTVTPAGDGVAILSENHIDLFDAGLNLLDSVDIRAPHIASNGRILVSAGDALTLWDVSGGRLEKISSIPLTTRINALGLLGTEVFLAQNESFTDVYEVSNRSLRRLATLPLTAGSFAAAGVRVYAISGGNVTVVDTASATPSVVGRLSFADSLLQSGAIVGNILFVVDRFTSVMAIDISDPQNLRVAVTITMPIRAIAASGDTVVTSEVLLDQNGFTAETSQPLTVFRASGAQLQELGSFHDFAGPLGGVAINGRYAFVADAPMFRVLDITT